MAEGLYFDHFVSHLTQRVKASCTSPVLRDWATIVTADHFVSHLIKHMAEELISLILETGPLQFFKPGGGARGLVAGLRCEMGCDGPVVFLTDTYVVVY